MSGYPPNNSTDPLDHLALRYLRQVFEASHPADEPYVLNEVESRVIGRAKLQTLLIAALLGAVGIVLYYGPQYLWPTFFSEWAISVWEQNIAIPIVSILYGLLLAYLEIYVLTYFNLRAIRTIMEVCQFPRAHDAQYERHLKAIAEAALKKTERNPLSLSIDPYVGIPRWGLTIVFTVTTVMATLSNVLISFLLIRVSGRVFVRQIVALVGMPIFALWNAFASWQILHEAQVRVIAPLTIREFVDELYEEWGKDPDFRRLILDTLQYIAVLKRSYNYAHYLLTETIVDRFGLSQTELPANFLDQLGSVSPAIRKGLERLIIFGVIVDGRLSWLEKQRLRELRDKGWLTYTMPQIKSIAREYNCGRGLWV